MFCCFIDFCKAFDNVGYWLLFCKLLEYNKSKACFVSLKLLAYWYSHQQMCVRWQTSHSTCFAVANGVRQGGLLSPYLFRIYIRDLINSVINSKAGCHIAGVCVSILAYADGMALLAPSWYGLQRLLNIIEKAAVAVDMTINLTLIRLFAWLLIYMIGENLCASLSLSYSWQIVTYSLSLSLNIWGILLIIRFVMIMILIESSSVCLLELMFLFVVSPNVQYKLN